MGEGKKGEFTMIRSKTGLTDATKRQMTGCHLHQGIIQRSITKR